MKKTKHKVKESKKAWVVTVDMGYGHQRPAYPFRDIAEGGVITANGYKGIPDKDKFIWENSRGFYEFISRFKMVPVIGDMVFDVYDKLQAIPSFYPKRDLSKSTLQLREIYRFFREGNWGKHLIDKLSKNPLPFLTTFFATAMMAEYFNYPGEIYCVLCDADIARSWVPPDPHKSRIIYLASNRRVADRLELYGVHKQNIILTGFPLPEENLGKNLSILKKDLGQRLINLDPKKKFIDQFKNDITLKIGRENLKLKVNRPVNIVFAVGGAGAQRELGIEIAQSLKKKIKDNKYRLHLVAGINFEVADYFKDELKKLKLKDQIGENINIVVEKTKDKYFKSFNKVLRNADILWTKPSELCFYCALGLPIIMAPTIGSQEKFNRKWLQIIGAGIDQEDPKYTDEWLEDWLNSGWLAEAALDGFVEAPKYGTYNIKKIIFEHRKEAKEFGTILQY
jgi:hypothetical protein